MEPITMTLSIAIIQLIGLPGLVFIIWHWDNRKFAQMSQIHAQEISQKENAIADVLRQYREDISEIKRLYENNAALCREWEAAQKRLEALYTETLSIISLNSQTQTRLVDAINVKTAHF